MKNCGVLQFSDRETKNNTFRLHNPSKAVEKPGEFRKNPKFLRFFVEKQGRFVCSLPYRVSPTRDFVA